MTVEEEEAFEREHGVPVNAAGSVVIAAWAMGLAILFVSVAFGALLLSYFYLRLENPVWPPEGIADPGLTWPAVAAALVVSSGVAMRVALGRVRAADQRGFVAGLAVAIALLAGGAVLQLRDVGAVGFGGTEHAYGSIFFTLSGFLAVVTAGTLVMGAMSLYWALRGLYDVRRHAAVANVTRFWLAAVVLWVTGFGVLHLGPHLT